MGAQRCCCVGLEPDWRTGQGLSDTTDGAAQFVVEVVGVDEVGEAIEIRIGQCVADQFDEHFVGGLQEAQQG